MEEVSIVGIGLAKQVFQVHVAASDGRVVFRKKLSRAQFPRFMAGLRPCIVRASRSAIGSILLRSPGPISPDT